MILQAWFNDLAGLVTKTFLINALIAITILVIGAHLAKRSTYAVARLPQLDTQQKLLVSKISYWGLLFFAIAAALSQVGVDIRVFLGAAGVLTVAMGFAAQTSASNLISGVFLMGEKPFIVGDVIKIGDLTGEIMSIDLLSSKIRTFNNLMVRVPNETMMKSNITNYSFFPVRRVDFNVSVGYESDLAVVESTLRKVATQHPLCLEDPAPVFLFNGFSDSAMSIQFQVWTLTANMLTLQNELYREIKLSFDHAGIKIPFPTRQLITQHVEQPRSPGQQRQPTSTGLS